MAVIHVSKERMDELFAEIEQDRADLAARIPTTVDALSAAFDARERLRSLGWADGVYCPKDGSTFATIEWGSTGVHAAHYMGDWPKGHLYAADFIVPPAAVMWKAIDRLTDDERAALDRSVADTREFIDRLGRAAIAQEQE